MTDGSTAQPVSLLVKKKGRKEGESIGARAERKVVLLAVSMGLVRWGLRKGEKKYSCHLDLIGYQQTC
jgi:hypothetical protein